MASTNSLDLEHLVDEDYQKYNPETVLASDHNNPLA